MNISEPIKVEAPKRISVLESAIIALGANAETGSKMVYLSPAQAELLFLRIRQLEDENADLRKHRAKLEHSVISLSEISKPQPFWMEPEK